MYTLDFTVNDWHEGLVANLDNPKIYGVNRENLSDQIRIYLDLEKEKKMSNLMNKVWWNKALIRCIKTMAQSGIAVIGTSTIISQIDWKVVVSTVAVSGLLSLLTSLGGLPEVEDERVEESKAV